MFCIRLFGFVSHNCALHKNEGFVAAGFSGSLPASYIRLCGCVRSGPIRIMNNQAA